ncbi:MAG: transposase [Candidatus Thioglobus sp.]|nr:MAG: transposase [Candidatus Thioglobus sp.]
MLRQFTTSFPEFKIKSVLADALYGASDFMDEAETISNGAQIVSQLRTNQIVASKNSKARVDIYFNRQQSVELQLTIRGGENKKVNIMAARLYVNAHGKRRFVIALKYDGEENYRYLIASNMSWHHHDIARLYTLRWLVEVFIQDWKAHCGWNKLSKQQGVDGSEHGLILSLRELTAA